MENDGLITAGVRFDVFMEAMGEELPEYLADLRREALKDGIPIIRTDTGRLLKLLMNIYRPEAILEVGTATGFSSVFMCHVMDEYSGSGGRIITIENYKPRLEKSREVFSSMGLTERIDLLEGDAGELVPSLEAQGKMFDMIFLDAAKGQYPVLYPHLRKMVRPGGLLITDNILQNGEILDSSFGVRRRDRTIHSRMREYVRMLLADEDFTSTVLPLGDGVAVSVRKK